MRRPDLASGHTYEHTYSGWLTFFEDCAVNPGPVHDVPRSWVPFLMYLGCTVTTPFVWFSEDSMAVPVAFVSAAINAKRLRELVEFSSTLRPELVDALYRSDVVWATKNRQHQWQDAFNVTCNGSFFRPEVVAYIDQLRKYEPPHAPVTIVLPCAADKPYPAALHRAVRDIAPHANLVIATGVLGLIPEDLWPICPTYDSGIPNEVRVHDEVIAYFHRNATPRVVVYCDFYAPTVMDALSVIGIHADWPIARTVLDTTKVYTHQNHAHVEYINLLAEPNLAALRECLYGDRE